MLVLCTLYLDFLTGEIASSELQIDQQPQNQDTRFKGPSTQHEVQSTQDVYLSILNAEYLPEGSKLISST
jgi:hypothetical protein